MCPLSLPAASAAEIAAGIRAGACSAEEVVRHCLDRIAAHDGRVRAFLHVDPDAVLEQARRIDARVHRGDTAGVLLGVPVAVKDNLNVAGTPTTCASRILQDYIPLEDAHVVQCLREAGAVLLGKTNLDEFAMGASTENSGFFATRNPHDLGRVPGGSSGGSAAAVAAGFAPLAVGSDTGGSVRQPAALCGVAGLRPTYGAVSRNGLVAFASSLDQVGPLARSVTDAALLFEVLAQADPRDSTCSSQALAGPESRADVRGLRIGIPEEYHPGELPGAVHQALERTLTLLREAGADLVRLSLPLTRHAIPAYYLLVASEASSNLARYDGVRYGPRDPAQDLRTMYEETRARGFGDEVKRRIILGTFALSAGYADAYYRKALEARERIRAEFANAFQSVDLLLGPTSPTPAFRLGEKTQDPLELYLCDVFTAPASLAGLPALSLPAGRSQEGLPLAVQLTGPRWSDRRVLRCGALLEGLLGGPPAPVEP